MKLNKSGNRKGMHGNHARGPKNGKYIHGLGKQCARNQRRVYQRMRNRWIMFLGGKCNRCGNNDSRVLQLDHIEGGGCRSRTARPIYKQMKEDVFNYPERYQILCANCNAIKRFERNENAKAKYSKVADHVTCKPYDFVSGRVKEV